MATDVAGRVYLAALDGEDAIEAFGEGFDTATEPPAATDLLRSLADTRVWATRATDVLSELDRGDYVLFHRDWGIRCVAQVWATTADSGDVAAHTEVDEPAGEWGLVTLTNAQRALDHVSLLSLDVADAQRDDSLYRIDPEVAANLDARFTTPARFVEETVANPLAFDVPPGGTPPDRRAEPDRPAGTGTDADVDAMLDAHLDALDSVRSVAWRALALGGLLLAATLAVAALYRPADGDPFSLTTTVALGVVAVGVGVALSTGVVLHGALRPRPGLAEFARERAAGARRAGTTEPSRDTATHLANAAESYCAFLDRLARRLGAVAATGAVGVLLGCVYVAYGLGVQVSAAVRPLSVVALAALPVLVAAVTLYALQRHGDVVDRLLSPGVSLGERAAAAKRGLTSLVGRIR